MELDILFNIDKKKTYKFLEKEMTNEKWIKFAKIDCVNAFEIIRIQDRDSCLYDNNGWYKVYKVIISKYPSLIKHIKTIDCAPRGHFHRRLTDQQYNELCELAGNVYTEFKNEPIEKKRKFEEEKKNFLTMLNKDDDDNDSD